VLAIPSGECSRTIRSSRLARQAWIEIPDGLMAG
jgi:hypothetical protein